MKKRFLAALICAATVLSLTGCENSGNMLRDLWENETSNTSSSTESKTSDMFESVFGTSEPAVDANGAIDWDSVPYADKNDFEVVHISYFDQMGVEELSETWEITKYVGKEKIIKIPEV